MTGATARSYPRQDLLVEPEWLAGRLDDPSLRVIDCDQPELSFARAHIRGAVTLPVHPYVRDLDTGVGVATPGQAEQIFQTVGINTDTQVICYDSQGGLLAARVWWVLWYYGHENVAVLNGGWNAWLAAGLPTATRWARPEPGNWSATAHEERIAACDVMLPWVDQADFVPLDVRAYQEWAGTQPSPTNMREGHIPGAVHIEWREFVDWQNASRFKAPGEIRDLLESHGVTHDKRVVPY